MQIVARRRVAVVVSGSVRASECLCKGNKSPSNWSPVVNNERMKPGHWFWFMFYALCSLQYSSLDDRSE